jgi:hypothetical protein
MAGMTVTSRQWKGATRAVLVAAGAALTLPPAAAQAQRGEQLQRQARINELQRLELDRRLRANPDIPPGQRMLFDYGGYGTVNYLSLDDPESANHVLREYTGIGYGRLNIDGAQELFLSGIIGYRDFHHGDSFSGRGDEPIDGDLYRGYYRVDLRRFQQAYGGNPQNDFNLVLQAGRDLVYWGNGLVMAQVIDGGIANVELGRLNLELIGGVTPVRTVDIDSSRPGFDYNTRRGFYGALLSADLNQHRPFLYYVAQRDYNEMDTLRTGTITTRYEYNSFYLGGGATGQITDKLRYGIEGAYEFGKTLSNSFQIVPPFGGLEQVDQTDDAIVAAAIDARLDYLVTDPADTRLSLEVTLATGDDDRGHTSNTFNGNAPGTEDNAFNAFGLVNTGLAFAPDVSNVAVLRVGASTFPLHDYSPLRRLQVGTDFFVFGKFDEDAPIDETTTRGQQFLGFEPDVYVNWQVTSDLTLAVRYGAFFPNASAFPIDDVRQFFYAGVTFAF